MKKRTAAIVAGATLVVAGTATAVGTSSIGWKHHTTRHIGGSVRAVVVDGNAGDIRVTSERRGDVLVRSTTSWIFRRPKLTMQVRDGVLRIETHRHGLFGAVDYRVRVPNGVDVTVRADAGDVSVDAAARHISVDTDAGDVHVKVPYGRYHVETRTDAGDEHVRGLVNDPGATRTIDARS